ncbi:serine/arginine repetitive matrix protein 1 [Melia azedarach]|uniref:Serine/arginine repetitive matrix protein 1 n=1 Tax=Melia azedarach TaxID=155640 RepID=A0ACC1WP21_MELAZ|nr:serine/arginine repetitive matrix protein 1 [Melia azedarach]
MTIDDSFRKPGSVPFKWEIRPGVPKIQQQQQQKQTLQPPPSPPPDRRSSPPQPQKLRPPPAGFHFVPPLEPRSQSFRSTPRTRSERWRFEKPVLRPECVSPGCFPTPLLRRKESSKRSVRVPRPESEPGYSSDLETLARWSVSSRKSLSTFTASPASSSFSSYKSSPRPMGDAEWAGFGLF